MLERALRKSSLGGKTGAPHMMTNPTVSTLAEDNAVPPPAPSDAQLAAAWFDEPPPSTRRPSSIPPPSVQVGEFLGDEIADRWLR